MLLGECTVEQAEGCFAKRDDRLTLSRARALAPDSTAGLKATRGDDVYHEDETTAALEDRIARLTGKEAAMFCVSGTMTNRASPAALWHP